MSSDVASEVPSEAAAGTVGRPLWIAFGVMAVLLVGVALMGFWQAGQSATQLALQAKAGNAQVKQAESRVALVSVKAAWRLGLSEGDEQQINRGKEALTRLQQSSRVLVDFGFPEDEQSRLNQEVASLTAALEELTTLHTGQREQVAGKLVPALTAISADLEDIRTASQRVNRTEVVALIDALLTTWQPVVAGTNSPAVYGPTGEGHPLNVDWAGLTAQFQAIADQMRSAAYREKGAQMVTRVQTLASDAGTFTAAQDKYTETSNQAFAVLPGQIESRLSGTVPAGEAGEGSAGNLPAIIGGILCLAALLVAFLAIRGHVTDVNQGIHELADMGLRLIEGERDLDSAQAARGDSLGRAALVLHALDRDLAGEDERREAAQAAVAAVREEVHNETAGSRISDEERREFDRLRQEASGLAELLTQVVSVMQNASRDVNQLTHDMVTVTQESGQAAGAAGDGVAVVAENTRQVFELLSTVSERTDTAARVAETSGQNADAVEGLIEDLSDSALGIDSVIELIEKIVGATRLLSLNASIEAARSGEAGRGFSVIASEIKSLSDKTAEATEEIRNKINRIKDCTRTVTDAVGGIIRVIHELSDIIGTISGSVESQRSGLNAISEAAVSADSSIQASAGALTGVNDSVSALQKAVTEMQSAADEIARNAEKGQLVSVG